MADRLPLFPNGRARGLSCLLRGVVRLALFLQLRFTHATLESASNAAAVAPTAVLDFEVQDHIHSCACLYFSDSSGDSRTCRP